MRYLKKKIARAQEIKAQNDALHLSTSKNDTQKPANTSVLPIRERLRRVQTLPTTVESPLKEMTSSNNIMKNYSRAFVNFATSEVCLPYLTERLEQQHISLDLFQDVLISRKSKINCISSLRQLLLPHMSDQQDIAGFKRVFREICEIFLKYFAVNWIFHSKVNNKMSHLKYRFKILRRVQNPEHFTYLESFSNHSKAKTKKQ